MSHRKFSHAVTAIWECQELELPDDDMTTRTLVLVPSVVFGDSFHVEEELGQSPPIALGYPGRRTVRASVSKLVYTLMVRFQQGSEITGDEPPMWALVDNSAVDNETGRTLEPGEVFPITFRNFSIPDDLLNQSGNDSNG